MGASLDFKAARKQVKVREQDQGMLLFDFAGQLYGYTVCHFGAPRSPAPAHRAPSACTAWLYEFNFRSETVSLEPDKLAKLAAQIQALLDGKKADKKALQSCLGLLNWATSISHHWATTSGPTQHPCTPTSTALQELSTISTPAYGSASFSAWTTGQLSSDRCPASTSQPPPESSRWAASGCAGSQTCPYFLTQTSLRVADPAATEIVLTKSSKEALAWLLSCVQSTPTKPLSDPHLLRCMSAADAMASWE